MKGRIEIIITVGDYHVVYNRFSFLESLCRIKKILDDELIGTYIVHEDNYIKFYPSVWEKIEDVKNLSTRFIMTIPFLLNGKGFKKINYIEDFLNKKVLDYIDNLYSLFRAESNNSNLSKPIYFLENTKTKKELLK